MNCGGTSGSTQGLVEWRSAGLQRCGQITCDPVFKRLYDFGITVMNFFIGKGSKILVIVNSCGLKDLGIGYLSNNSHCIMRCLIIARTLPWSTPFLTSFQLGYLFVIVVNIMLIHNNLADLAQGRRVVKPLLALAGEKIVSVLVYILFWSCQGMM